MKCKREQEYLTTGKENGMKKRMMEVLAVLLSSMLAASAFAAPVNSQKKQETHTTGETDGSRIPKDEPVSTTGTAYGYQGSFDVDHASTEQVDQSEGEREISGAQMIFWEGPVIRNTGTSSLVVKDSLIRGETTAETVPLSGTMEGLLTSGDLRTTLAGGNSESIYVNSTIVSRNGGVLSAEEAQPAPEGGKELRIYAYGSEVIAMDGGYAACSDLFCNLYAFGSHFQSAEIGILSGTYGKVTIGNIEDGEKDPVLSKALTQTDKDKRSDKKLSSVIEGGRNALMIHSVNLPSYHEFEGYSEKQLPLLKTDVHVHGSILRTDLRLDKGVEYETQQKSYIDHTKGSVILIKSTNVDLSLDDCMLVPDLKGTGCLIQTVCSNDTQHMNAVPEGETYPGVNVAVKDSVMSGSIVHEDYQRDLFLTMTGSKLTGYMNEYDCAHWNEVSKAEGFPDYCKDAAYNTRHGIMASLQGGSSWIVTKESHLSRLDFTEDSKVIGLIFVDGVEQKHEPGRVYEGDVVVKPGTPKEEAATEHEHNWTKNGGSPAGCENDGVQVWKCTICGEEYKEPLKALGHKWTVSGKAADCIHDGKNVYTCERCGKSYTETVPATGHNWKLTSSIAAGCENWGQDVYTCSACGEVYYVDHAPLGHSWETVSYSSPTCGSDGWETDQCKVCGATKTETFAAYGHHWEYQYSQGADCDDEGYDVYMCTECGMMDYQNVVPALGHSYTVYPTPGYENIYHTFYCTNCSASYDEYHTVSSYYGYDEIYHYYYCPVCGKNVAQTHYGDPCACGHTGPVG